MERLLIWFHAYDRINYARHFTYCWASLTNLHESHPTIYEEFKRGNFAVKRSPGNFNMIPPDQVIEQTVNREQKGAGEIIGSTTSTGCVQRWILSSHVAAAWCADFKESIGFNRVESGSKDLRCARKKFNEKSGQACYQTIEQWNNPFQPQENLIVLSSDVVASEEVQKDLLQAKEVEQTRLDQFLNERIIEGKVEFNATITKNFDSSTQKKTTVAIKSDRETFGRLLIIQQIRGIDLEEVLQYELSPLPLLSIANTDGSLTKNVKSKLFSFLAETISQLESVPPTTVTINDGMVLLRKLPASLSTFGDVSDYLLSKILKAPCRVAFFVKDFYLPDSIKSKERARRSKVGSLRITALRRTQQKPVQFTKYLQNAENKIELIRFLIVDWTNCEKHITTFLGKELYVTCESDAYRLYSDGERIQVNAVGELESKQEEADTKIFFCQRNWIW